MIPTTLLASLALSAPLDGIGSHGPTGLPDIVASPLRALDTGHDRRRGDATRLELRVDETLVELARRATETRGVVTLGGIPLPGGVAVDLELASIDPFTADATFVVVDAGGRERVLPRPDVVALAGSVVGDDDGEAFLAFGPAGVEGWIRIDGISFGVSDGVAGGPLLVHRLDALPPIDPELLANFCGTDLLDPIPGTPVAEAAAAPEDAFSMGPRRPGSRPGSRPGNGDSIQRTSSEWQASHIGRG